MEREREREKERHKVFYHMKKIRIYLISILFPLTFVKKETLIWVKKNHRN